MAEAVKAPETERNAASPWASWEAVCEDPNLRRIPYKVETNERGQIIMSPPPAPKHGGQQATIARLLKEHLSEGQSVTECPVRTPGGTKAPDTVWFSAKRWSEVKDVTGDSPIAPEICVEVLSPSNTEEEMEEKRALYFEAGAEEVWICDTEGRMYFFMPDGEHETSARVPGFPRQIEL